MDGLLRVEQLRDVVMALRPVYNSQGANATEIICVDGRVIMDNRRVKTVTKALLRSYALDLPAQHEIVRNCAGRQSVLPFYLPKGRIFIPLKMRQAVGENDQVYGYVDLSCLGHFAGQASNRCVVPLSNGLELEVLSSKKTALESQAVGKKLAEFLKKEDEKAVVTAESIMESGQQISSFFYSIKKQLDRIEDACRDEMLLGVQRDSYNNDGEDCRVAEAPRNDKYASFHSNGRGRLPRR